MKKLGLMLLILSAGFVLQAQERFEFGASAKAGYYFPNNAEDDPIYPENTFSPGIGIYLNYNVFNKTNIGVGLDYNYLNPGMLDQYKEPLDVPWHSINFPIYLKQSITNNLFVSAGATIVKQLGDVNYRQKVPEFNWQAGFGWEFKKLNVSLQYVRGFQKMKKYIPGKKSTSFYSVDIRHQEIYLKVEYPLWSF